MLYDLGLWVDFTHAGSQLFERGRNPEFSEIKSFEDHSVIFILRDPRDVLVSYHIDLKYRHQAFKGSLMEMAKTPGIGLDGICDFNILWLESSKKMRDFKVVRYEELVEQPEELLRQVCKFLRAFWISNKNISKVVEKSSFNEMKRLEENGVYGLRYPKYWFEGGKNGLPPKVRRGKAGGFIDEMPKHVRRYCDDRLFALKYPQELLAEPLGGASRAVIRP